MMWSFANSNHEAVNGQPVSVFGDMTWPVDIPRRPSQNQVDGFA